MTRSSRHGAGLETAKPRSVPRKQALGVKQKPPEIARTDALPADAKTRERLVHAARKLLEEGGYASASVQAIAERADVSAGALYRHYPSKAELFVEVFRSAANAQIAELRTVTSSGNGIERIEAAVASFASRALSRRKWSWALMHEPVDASVDAERLIFRREYCRLLAALLRAAITAGEIPEQNVELTAAALVGAVGESLIGPLAPLAGEVAADTEVIANLLRFCGRGIGARDRANLRRVKS